MSPLWDFFCPSCSFVLEDYMIWEQKDEFIPCPQCATPMTKRIPVVNVKIKNGTPVFYPNRKKKEK